MTTPEKILAASPAPPTSGDLAAAVLRVLADKQPSAKHWHCDDLRTLADQLGGALSQGEASQPLAPYGDRGDTEVVQ